MKYLASDLRIRPWSDQPNRVSFVWQWFGDLLNKENVNVVEGRVFCRYCLALETQHQDNLIDIEVFKNKSSYSSSNNQSTNSHKLHLIKHNIREDISDDDKKKKLEFILTGTPEDIKLDQELFDLQTTMMMISTNTAFNFFENQHVKNFFSTFLPSFIPPNRSSIIVNLDKIYNLTNDAIISFFKNQKLSHASIDFDIAFNKIKHESYLGINVHFIHNREIQSVFLGAHPLEGYQKNDDLSLIINQVLKIYQLNETIIMYVTDGGNNLIKTIETLEQNGERCEMHSLHNLFYTDLNRISREFKSICLKVIKIHHKLLNKSHLMDQTNLLNIQETESEDSSSECEFELKSRSSKIVPSSQKPTKIKKQIQTRFLSSKDMLESVLKMKNNIHHALFEVNALDLYLSKEEWTSLENFYNLLNEVNIMAMKLSSHKIATQHLILIFRSEIEFKLTNFDGFDHKERSEMIKAFKKRLPVNQIQVMASLLHPKLIYLDTVNEYLANHHISREQFLIDFMEKFKIDIQSPSTKSSTLSDQKFEIDLITKHSTPPIKDKAIERSANISSEINNYFSIEYEQSTLNINSDLIHF